MEASPEGDEASPDGDEASPDGDEAIPYRVFGASSHGFVAHKYKRNIA